MYSSLGFFQIGLRSSPVSRVSSGASIDVLPGRGASVVDCPSMLVSSSVDVRDGDLVLIRVDRGVSVLLVLEL